MRDLLRRHFVSKFSLSLAFSLAVLAATPAIAEEPDCPEITEQTMSGVASWYGGKFHGQRTANGEIFNKNAYTAASLTYPANSILRVSNRQNGEAVTVRVNDKGPHKKGRIIDLSEAAAKAIGMYSSGTAQVVISLCVPLAGTISYRN